MLIPLDWLRDYVKVDLAVKTLAERLTLGGLEVKSIDHIGEDWDPDKIRVGQVLCVRQHPNADHLVLVTVEYGADEPLTVVTGAPNLKVGDAGQKVVFATVGARLVDPYADTLKYRTLKRSKIRGVPSAGMVCSERELGISDEHEGILILPDDAPTGMPFAQYWGDTVLDLDLTPNLARDYCLVGTARDTAALTGSSLSITEPTVDAQGDPLEGRLYLEIAAPDLCPRYSAALITGVKIGPSPLWMQRRLRLAGMRPINNIVDITNYVMLEWGQPLHAFDYRRLRPKPGGSVPTIIVRRAHDGERITTLDDAERTLSSDVLLITDGSGPVAIAGIMGGQETEVTDQTVDVLLEAANFDSISVRRASAELKIPSESAQRFGRGVDPELTLTALRRASELMRELAGGTVAKGFADLYPRKPQPTVIDLPSSEVARILGITLEAQEIASLLTPLGFKCEIVGEPDPVVRVSVPSYRLDVRIKADLLEEVARMVGYDRLPETLLEGQTPRQARDISLELEDRVRDALIGCGLTETISYSLTNLESVAKLAPGGVTPREEDYIALANPLTRENRVMRQTLMNTTLETTARNLRFTDRVGIFEIARVYLPAPGRDLPEEPSRLSIAMSGPRETRSWLAREPSLVDFYDLKGVIETVCTRLGITRPEFEPIQNPTTRPGRAAAISTNGRALGLFGEVHPAVAHAFDITGQPVMLAELDLDALLAEAQPTRTMKPISSMPALKEDLAIIVPENVPSNQVGEIIREVGGALLTDLVLFDVYRGPQVGEGRKSLAYSLSFQSPTKTLTSKQAANLRKRIVKRLQQEFGAELRG